MSSAQLITYWVLTKGRLMKYRLRCLTGPVCTGAALLTCALLCPLTFVLLCYRRPFFAVAHCHSLHPARPGVPALPTRAGRTTASSQLR